MKYPVWEQWTTGRTSPPQTQEVRPRTVKYSVWERRTTGRTRPQTQGVMTMHDKLLTVRLFVASPSLYFCGQI